MKKPTKELRQLVYLKACPRCNGDLHISEDMYGKYRGCLQCGYVLDITKVIESSYVRSVAKRSCRRRRAA